MKIFAKTSPQGELLSAHRVHRTWANAPSQGADTAGARFHKPSKTFCVLPPEQSPNLEECEPRDRGLSAQEYIWFRGEGPDVYAEGAQNAAGQCRKSKSSSAKQLAT